jgi:hypothetical protein
MTATTSFPGVGGGQGAEAGEFRRLGWVSESFVAAGPLSSPRQLIRAERLADLLFDSLAPPRTHAITVRDVADRIPYPSPLTPYPLPLTPYPLPLTPYPLPLTPYPLPLTPYPPIASRWAPPPPARGEGIVGVFAGSGSLRSRHPPRRPSRSGCDADHTEAAPASPTCGSILIIRWTPWNRGASALH